MFELISVEYEVFYTFVFFTWPIMELRIEAHPGLYKDKRR